MCDMCQGKAQLTVDVRGVWKCLLGLNAPMTSPAWLTGPLVWHPLMHSLHTWSCCKEQNKPWKHCKTMEVLCINHTIMICYWLLTIALYPKGLNQLQWHLMVIPPLSCHRFIYILLSHPVEHTHTAVCSAYTRMIYFSTLFIIFEDPPSTLNKPALWHIYTCNINGTFALWCCCGYGIM